MRADYLDRYLPLYTAGLKRLATLGAVFTNARYRHACTETGPGHSVLLSGRSPRSSGIVGNTWYDRTLKQRVNVVDDPTVRVLGGARPSGLAGVLQRVHGGRHAEGPLAALEGRGRVVQGPRGDPDGGRRADGAYWYEGSGGRFVTSSWYTDAAPGWLERWNARGLPASYARRLWERLLPDPAST